AGDAPHAACACSFEQRVDRCYMHGGEGGGGGGAVTQQFVTEEVGDLGGVGRVGEAALGGEGVFLQPFEQLLAVAGDDVGLRVMDVGVDEAGQDQLAAVIGERRAGRQLRQQLGRRAAFGDVAVAHDQHAVGEVFERARVVRRIGEEMHDFAADGGEAGGSHGAGVLPSARGERRSTGGE